MRRAVRSRLLAVGAVLGWALLLTAGLEAQEVDGSWRIEREERVIPVAADTLVRAENTLGDLAVRTHARTEVYLLVNWQHHADDTRGLVIESRSEPSELSLALAFEGADDDAVPQAWNKRRADMTLFVPETAATSFSTGAGKLEVRGTRAPTQVRTTTGDVKLRIYGSASVTTEHGDVLAQMRSAEWTPAVTIGSKTGRIRVELPRGCVLSATIETRGEVTSDYSMTVDRVPGSQLKRFRLKSTDSDSTVASLQLSSYSGPIQVVESLVTADNQRALTLSEDNER